MMADFNNLHKGKKISQNHLTKWGKKEDAKESKNFLRTIRCILTLHNCSINSIQVRRDFALE